MLRRATTLSLMFVTMVLATACGSVAAEELTADQAQMPASSDDLEGEAYPDVVEMLQDAGFSNIETVALGDLITGRLKDPDTVDEVEIGGVASFDKGEVFAKDVDIVVNYHSFPEDDVEVEGAGTPTAGESDDGAPSAVDMPFWCGDGYSFSTAAPIELRYTQGHIPVTVTVSAPVALATPTKPEANVVFTVTLANLSTDRAWSDPTLFALAAPTGDLEKSVINYGEWPTGYAGAEVGPGQTVTFTDEWKVEDPEDVRYELRVDGLAGDTVCFAG